MTSQIAPTAPPTNWKRTGLTVFLASVALNAVIAIAVILGVGGDAEWRILGTSLMLSAASIAVIANAAAHDRGRLGLLPFVVGAVVLVATGMGIVGVWAEPSGDAYYQWTGTFAVIGVAGTYAALIALPGLDPRHLWLRWAAVGLAGALAALTVASIWADDSFSGEVWGVLGVLLAAATIVVPVLARADQVAQVLTHDAHVRFCPFCGASVESAESNVATCSRCSASYTVTLDRRVETPVEPVA